MQFFSYDPFQKNKSIEVTFQQDLNMEKCMKLSIRIGLLLVLLLAFSSCSCLLDGSNARFSVDMLEDEAMMLQQGDSYFYRVNTSKVEKKEAHLAFTEFSGLDTIYRLECSETGEVSVSIHAEVNTSSYKLVLVDYERDEVHVLTQGANDAEGILQLAPGKYALKSVGYKVKGKIDIRIGASDAVRVIPQSW